MGIRILQVISGSPAETAGIRAGETLLKINNEPVIDEIDYQALTACSVISVELSDKEGKLRTVRLKKDEFERLGLVLDETIVMSPRRCRNHCQFCFVDQLPKGMRNSLYVKDDDWRLSMMMGNYITLTNVDDAEFNRILRRRVSPLYISVHATAADVRCSLMQNPNASNLMPRLHQLKNAGLQFHAQIVLCPGINDGAILRQSIEDLAGMFPSAQSLAIVPVGLTAHREKLSPLRLFDAASAEELIRVVEDYQNRYLQSIGTRFVYPSDEFYCISGHSLPQDEFYEDYVQIENGVGMLRKLEQECEDAWIELDLDSASVPAPKHYLIPTGTSANPFLKQLALKYAPPGTVVDVLPVVNHFFGESITVTGLLVGRDLLSALRDRECDMILISATMLKEFTDRFLDDMAVSELEASLHKPIRIICNDGISFVRGLWGMEDE